MYETRVAVAEAPSLGPSRLTHLRQENIELDWHLDEQMCVGCLK